MKQCTENVLPNYQNKFIGRSKSVKRCRSERYSFWGVLYGTVLGCCFICKAS